MINESNPRAKLANKMALVPRKIVTPESHAWTICSKFEDESFTPEKVEIRSFANAITRAIFTAEDKIREINCQNGMWHEQLHVSFIEGNNDSNKMRDRVSREYDLNTEMNKA